MNNVDYIYGSENIIDTPLKVFDDDVCAFIGNLSTEILKSPITRVYPDLSALAFWARKANIQKIKLDFGKTTGYIGRGMCFHIAPSNIPINFAFSYLFSLLAGNANIVRLPSQTYPQVDAFCSIFAQLIKKYPEIAKRTAFIRYSRDSETTAFLSKKADARMIWGGDDTITFLKSISVSPRCVDIAFADRYSFALLDGKAVCEAEDAQIQRLIENFYNDTYLMDQNACSSPQIILWQNDDNNARDRFWRILADYAGKKYSLQDAVSVDKYVSLCEESISNKNLKSIRRTGNFLYRAELKALTPDVVNHRGRGGFFYEYALENWEQLFSIVTDKFQTVTCFGIDTESFQTAVIKAHLKGIDRIVPVGKAMNIDSVWDGHDLIRELSRIIRVEK